MSSANKLFLAAAGVAAAAALGFWLLRGSPQVDPTAVEPPASSPAPVVEQAPTPPVSAPLVSSPLPTPESASIPKEDCIAYPDGTRLPPLNGVKKAPQMVFHRMVPFAKVVRIERDARGLDWYVHENGVRSTTRYQVKNGVQEAVSEIEMPAKVMPAVGDK